MMRRALGFTDKGPRDATSRSIRAAILEAGGTVPNETVLERAMRARARWTYLRYQGLSAWRREDGAYLIHGDRDGIGWEVYPCEPTPEGGFALAHPVGRERTPQRAMVAWAFTCAECDGNGEAYMTRDGTMVACGTCSGSGTQPITQERP